jgi:thioredoxin reductase (NADPH)
VAVEGTGNHLNSVHWRNSQTGQTEKHEISHIFVMTDADPNTRWLNGCVALDSKGFIKTDPDLSPENLSAAGWPLTRHHTCLKPVCQVFSLWVTCEAAASNVLHLQ